MTVPASAQLIAACRAMQTQLRMDKQRIRASPNFESRAKTEAEAMAAAYETLQRALADQLRSETA